MKNAIKAGLSLALMWIAGTFSTGGQTPLPGLDATHPGAAAAEGYSPAAAGGMTYTRPTSSSKDSAAPLLIQFGQADQRTLEQLDEDLNVMARLLDKNIDRVLGQIPDVKAGIPIIVNSSSKSVRAMYLQGFGALFMIKVNVPLFAPPSVEEKPVDAVSDSSDWESTRLELNNLREEWVDNAAPTPGSQFDDDQIKALRTELLKTLKNAVNIRGLKPSDFVTLTVFGAPNSADTLRLNDKGRASGGQVSNRSASANPGKRGTVMTLRVLKSDIDQFAKQKGSFEDFQKKVAVSTYAAKGHSTASLNTWSERWRSTIR